MLHLAEFPSELVRVEGALDFERTPRGLRPRRLPAWTRAQLTDPLFDLVVQATAGVRLVFRTEATALELTVHFTRVGLPGVGTLPTMVDLLVDGEPAGRQGAVDGDVILIKSADGDVELVPGSAEVLRFEGLAVGDKEVQVWLPQGAACDLVSLGADAPIRTAPVSVDRHWIHYGSSISHCVEADGPTGTWPAIAAAAAHLRLTGLGFSGNAMLDPFVARTIRDLPADLISLELGANIVGGAAMRERTFLPAVHGFLDTIREGQPETPVVVVSPIACPMLEDLPGPTVPDPATGNRTLGTLEDIRYGALTLSAVRGQLEEIVRERSKTDRNLSYLDGRTLLGADEVDSLHDGLHPDAAGYRRMGARFAAALADG